MKHQIGRRLRCLVWALVACVASATISGCTDLATTAKYASAAVTAAGAFPALVADQEQSCRRRAVYSPQSIRADVLKQADEYKKLAPELIAANALLADYLAAIASLSGDEPLVHKEPLENLSTRLKSARFNEKQANAAVGLTTALAKAALNGYRRRHLGKVIGDANESVQVYAAALADIVGKDHISLLETEERALNDFYETAIRTFQDKEPLTVILIKRAWQEDLAQLQKRKVAAQAYVTVLENIGEGHQKLFDRRDKLSSKELFTIAGPYIEQIGKASFQLYNSL